MCCRYRELRKHEEKKVNDRHGRMLRKHAEFMRNSFENNSDERVEIMPSSPPLEEFIEEQKDILNEPIYPPNSVIHSDLVYSKVLSEIASTSHLPLFSSAQILHIKMRSFPLFDGISCRDLMSSFAPVPQLSNPLLLTP